MSSIRGSATTGTAGATAEWLEGGVPSALHLPVGVKSTRGLHWQTLGASSQCLAKPERDCRSHSDLRFACVELQPKHKRIVWANSFGRTSKLSEQVPGKKKRVLHCRMEAVEPTALRAEAVHAAAGSCQSNCSSPHTPQADSPPIRARSPSGVPSAAGAPQRTPPPDLGQLGRIQSTPGTQQPLDSAPNPHQPMVPVAIMQAAQSLCAPGMPSLRLVFNGSLTPAAQSAIHVLRRAERNLQKHRLLCLSRAFRRILVVALQKRVTAVSRRVAIHRRAAKEQAASGQARHAALLFRVMWRSWRRLHLRRGFERWKVTSDAWRTMEAQHAFRTAMVTTQHEMLVATGRLNRLKKRFAFQVLRLRAAEQLWCDFAQQVVTLAAASTAAAEASLQLLVASKCHLRGEPGVYIQTKQALDRAVNGLASLSPPAICGSGWVGGAAASESAAQPASACSPLTVRPLKQTALTSSNLHGLRSTGSSASPRIVSVELSDDDEVQA